MKQYLIKRRLPGKTQVSPQLWVIVGSFEPAQRQRGKSDLQKLQKSANIQQEPILIYFVNFRLNLTLAKFTYYTK